MSRRIIGQCSTADFRDLQGLLARSLTSSQLVGREKAAMMVINHFQLCGVPFDVLFKIREVLVWEMPGSGLAFEYKLKDSRDTETFNLLLRMSPTKVTNKKEVSHG